MGYAFERNEIVLFQGDSITDAGRFYLRKTSLGEGYPVMVSEKLKALLPDRNIQCMNKGVSGDRISDMKKRFRRDCTGLYPFPTIVSIYIGINDTWRRFDMGLSSPIERFEQIYRELIGEIRKTSAFTKLILLSPFVLEDEEEKRLWREDLGPRREAVKRVAESCGTRFVDLQQVFDDAMRASGQGPLYYTVDGVHPTPAGHALIAEKWIEAFRVG